MMTRILLVFSTVWLMGMGQVSPQVSQEVMRTMPTSFSPILGTYRVEGLSEVGIPYTIQAHIDAYGEGLKVTWTYPSGDKVESLAILRGNILAVTAIGSALSEDDLWVAIYEAHRGEDRQTVLVGVYTTDYLGGYLLPENMWREGL